MDWMHNKSVTLAALAGGALCILAAWQLSAPLLTLAAALLFSVSLLIWKWGYWLGPIIASSTRTALSGGGYELTPGQDVMIHKTPAGYRAAVFMSIALRDSAAHKSESQKTALIEHFERAVSSLRHPVKLSVLVCGLDIGDHIQKLQERRSLAEHKRAQLRARQSDEAARLERDIESYTQQLRRLSGGERPMQVLAYAATTAQGLTREEVLSRVRAQAQESAAVLASALACEVRPLAGEEMLQAFEWEKFHPSSRSEVENALF